MRRLSRTISALLLAGATLSMVPAYAATATARKPYLPTPTGVHLIAATQTSLSVECDPVPRAEHYRVFASLTRRDVWVANLRNASRSRWSSHPQVTVDGLRYSTRPYYYRLEVTAGPHKRFSNIFEGGVQPYTPTHLQVTSKATGTYLTWRSRAAAWFVIRRATDAQLTKNVHLYLLRSDTRQYTPLGLTGGHAYYFGVRGLNSGTPSLSSNVTLLQSTASSQQTVRVMTYNVTEKTADGRSEGGGTVAPWSKRLPGVLNLIREASPDVVAVQEAATWTGRKRGPRQIDSMNSRLSAYVLAKTEIPPSQPHFKRTGNYILYRPATLRAVGQGGHWNLGNQRFAAYQIFQDKQSGAKFLLTSSHLWTGRGAASDANRRRETHQLLQKARSRARGRFPVIYAGDFNSHATFVHGGVDGPGAAMSAANVADAISAAQRWHNVRYNSANGYMRRPPASGTSIDHVYAAPGIGVRSWTELLHLQHGQFVGVIPSDHNPVVTDLSVPYAYRPASSGGSGGSGGGGSGGGGGCPVPVVGCSAVDR